jgi:hypothetical protein
MPVAWDANLSGYGEAALDVAGELAYGLSRFVTLGAFVDRYNPPDGTHVRGLGWLSIGFTNDDGSGDKVYYQTPIFIVLSQQLYQFGVGTLDGTIKWGPYADHMRWWIDPGSTVHMWIYAFDT